MTLFLGLGKGAQGTGGEVPHSRLVLVEVEACHLGLVQGEGGGGYATRHVR